MRWTKYAPLAHREFLLSTAGPHKIHESTTGAVNTMMLAGLGNPGGCSVINRSATGPLRAKV